MKKITFLFLFLLISLGLVFSSGFFNKNTEAKLIKDQTPEEYYHIDERIVLGGDKAFNIGNAISPIASIAKKYCKDKVDEEGNVIEEGYFRYSATTNYFQVEVDKESGYAIGQGKVVIHYEKKCPGYLAAKAFKNSGDAVATINAKGKVGKDGMIHGTANISLKVPTLVSFKLNFSSPWEARYTLSFVGPSVFSINVAKFGFSADFPITVPIESLESPQLIEFEIVKEEGRPTFLPPINKEMTADGEESQTFTISMEQKAILINKKNKDIIDDSYEGGVEGEEFVLQTRVKQIKLNKDTPNYGDIDELKSTCDGSSCDNLSLTTDKEGKASFIYKPPKIEEEEFTGADVSFRAISSKGEPVLKIKVYPAGGIIKGKLVNLKGKKFDSDIKARLIYPSGTGEGPEDKEIKAGTGNFSFKTKIPVRGYKLMLVPSCEGCKRRIYGNLPYIIDLGNVLLGTIKDYEQGALNDIRNLFKGSGAEVLLGDFLDGITFNYEGRGPEYDGGVVYLPSENFMMNANDPLTTETVFHEIFHGIHSALAEHGWIHKHFKLGGEHKMWEESSERVAWDEALSHFFPRLLMMAKGIGYESEDYRQRSIDSDNTNDNGNLVEGKIAAFLVDYYQYKKLTPSQILGDLYHTMRSYGDIPDGAGRPTQTIAEWILTKLWMDPTDYKLNALMNKHNIKLDCIENIDWGSFTIVKSDMNGRRTEAERQKSLQNRQQRTSANQTKTHSVKTGSGDVGKNTTYRASGDTAYAVEDSGQCELDSGTIVARNGGAVNTAEARVIPAGTVYSVTALDGKTIVKVAKGEVEIMNTETWESYLAEAGEEVEIYGDKIVPVAVFDPKVEPEFKRGFMDYFYEYFSWMNLLILAGVIVVLIIVLLIIKKIIKKK